MKKTEKKMHSVAPRYLKLVTSSTWKHKMNDWVRSKINFLVGPQEPILATVKRRKLA